MHPKVKVFLVNDFYELEQQINNFLSSGFTSSGSKPNVTTNHKRLIDIKYSYDSPKYSAMVIYE